MNYSTVFAVLLLAVVTLVATGCRDDEGVESVSRPREVDEACRENSEEAIERYLLSFCDQHEWRSPHPDLALVSAAPEPVPTRFDRRQGVHVDLFPRRVLVNGHPFPEDGGTALADAVRDRHGRMREPCRTPDRECASFAASLAVDAAVPAARVQGVLETLHGEGITEVLLVFGGCRGSAAPTGLTNEAEVAARFAELAARIETGPSYGEEQQGFTPRTGLEEDLQAVTGRCRPLVEVFQELPAVAPAHRCEAMASAGARALKECDCGAGLTETLAYLRLLTYLGPEATSCLHLAKLVPGEPGPVVPPAATWAEIGPRVLALEPATIWLGTGR